MNFIWLDAVATGGAGWSNILMIVAMVAVVWFFMIRPQQKRQKELEKSRSEMTRGDRVITSGGIHAEIKEVREDSFIIEIAPDVRVRIDKGSVFAAKDSAERK
ncbi:MAG: preprotein translocase subunit YajC [Porphyromonadaceae bacterium]|nr:preprotein translocase subunit YajC [Porphyromonadaceae bacterium]